MIKSLIVSLVLTLIIELTVSFFLGIRDRSDFKIVFYSNICTNPIVVFISNCALLLNNYVLYFAAVAILEISAVFVEFAFYKKYLHFKKISPMVLSVICNAISFYFGMTIIIIKEMFI